jgi:hypothetical protein
MGNKLILVLLFSLSASCGGGGGGAPKNTAPTFSSQSTANVLEGATAVMDVATSDPESNTVSLTLSGTDSSLFILTGNALSFSAAPDFEVPGSAAGTNEYSLTLSATDGTNTTDQSVTVTVNDATEGRVIDGPLSGANIFIDTDGDLIQDDNEPSVTTDATGFFKLPLATAAEGVTLKLVSIGGMDTSTGKLLPEMALVSDVPATGEVVVTPLSTIVAAATTLAAKKAVLVSLGISGTVGEVLAKDTWALAESGDAAAIKMQTANLAISAVLQSATSLINTSDASAATANATNVVASIAAQIVTQAVAGADIFDATVLATVLEQGVETYAAENQTDLVIDTAVFAAVADSLATVVVVIKGAGNPTSADAISIATTLQESLQTAVAAVAISGDTAAFTIASESATLFEGASATVSAIVMLDTDGDGIINTEDPDIDNDGYADSEDDFPFDPAEHADTDADGIGNNSDAFPLDSTESVDTDSDGVGNNADTDDDADGVADTSDTFPLISIGDLTDTDADGRPNNCDAACVETGMSADTDNDGDSVADTSDAFPLDPTESVDTDSDGIGNNADTDDDADGVADTSDAFPLDPAESVDTDGDGIGNNADTDTVSIQTPIPPAPQVTLTSSDSELLVGNSVTLTWSSSNATSCSASGDWSGPKGSNGSESISVDSAMVFEYTLECTGEGGITLTSASVSGYQDTSASAPQVTLTSSDSELLVGNSVTLTWSSSNATSCSASGDWSGSKGSNGTESISVDSTMVFEYTLECTGEGGITSTSVSVSGYQETSAPIECKQFTQNAGTNEFRYCWEEDQTTSGTDYSANVISPLTVTFDNVSISVPDSNFAEQLYIEYGIILSSNGDVVWDNEKAYAIHQMMKKIPQYVKSAEYDNRVFSKWTLTESELTDDIQITTNTDDTRIVNISSAAFTNANPRVVAIEGKKGRYFSNRLHNSVVRFVTQNGTDKASINKILNDRYGVSLTPSDYGNLTKDTTNEVSNRFQAFQASELLAIINMFEEMPSGFHKIQGLNYLIRRIDGAQHPLYSEAPAVAWSGAGYIEFMESAFKTFDLEYMHRVILHEKAHFLYSKVFDTTLLDDWANLGGWSHSSGDSINNFYTVDGWTTSKQTEFVSNYAHSKNPNEDMAESISYFIINPDPLRSRAEKKYEFIRDRIMQGDIYISQIQDNLTFTVYNLYPDYVFPGKVNLIKISVEGEPNDDKTVTVEIELHALNKVLEGAKYGLVRIVSEAGTYFDLYLYPTDGSSLGTQLLGSHTLSKYAKSGYWQASNLTLTDQSGNKRMERAGNDFGWRMYVNNPEEDLVPPEYVAQSISLIKTTREVENQVVDVVIGQWEIDEAHPKENQGCYGALNDDLATTYSIQRYSPQSYGGEYQANKCYVEYLMPYYMPSGIYRLNYIFQYDAAGNRSENYLKIPDGADGGEWPGGEGVNGQLDENAPEIILTTSSPDTTAPELDLNIISITAAPTNPENPNGETIVEFKFRVKDDISGYKLGYYKFRDPQGLTSGYYHYPDNRDSIFPVSQDTEWYEYTSTVILPIGSAPGQWGVTELTLRDRALNFKSYDFTEIVTFDVTE